MRKYFTQNLTIAFLIIVSISFINSSYIYALGSKEMLRGEAESYRAKGYEAQESGDIDNAITWYTKAVMLDPSFAAAYNDLGILYEAKGWLDRAESQYQRALTTDSNYEKSHTNLALLYERKGEIEKAAFHWMRRYKLGKLDDPWTDEAKERLEKLGLIDRVELKREIPRQRTGKVSRIKKTPYRKTPPEIKKRKKIVRKKTRGKKRTEKKARKKQKGEWTRVKFGSKKSGYAARTLSKTTRNSDMERKLQESLRLAEKRLREEKGKEKTKKTTNAAKKTRQVNKSYKRKGPDSKARRYYREADSHYKKGEYSKGLDVIRTAKRKYPKDVRLLKLEESIKTKMKEERIIDHYEEGIMLYRQDEFSGARKEFEAMLNILPE